MHAENSSSNLTERINKLKQEIEKKDNEIENLEQTLYKLNKKLEEAEAIKSHFVSNVSNEIVNPFTSVLALTDSILGVEKENWKKVISMVSLIHTEVSHLDFQLKNIFAAAKIEAGELSPEISTVDLNSLINHVIESFKYDSRHKNISIKYFSENKNADTKILFKTDSEKLHLILSNLLSNAIKFSHQNGEITIKSIRAFDKLIIEVQDHGIGISHENQSVIFDRFKRLDSGINSLNRGHGLGLSVNKAVLDILEGSISFLSKVGEGATFIVNITESSESSSGFSSDSNELFFKEEKF